MFQSPVPTQSAAPPIQSPRSLTSSSVTTPITSTNHSRVGSFQPQQPSRLSSSTVGSPTITPAKPRTGSQDLFSALSQTTSSVPPIPKPLSPPVSQIQLPKPQPPKPNYNVTLEPMTLGTTTPISSQPPFLQSTFQPLQPSAPSLPSAPLVPTPSQMPGMGGILTPSRPAQSPWNANKKPSQNDWGDFDPLA